MKKITLILGLATLFAFASCSSENKEANTEAEAPAVVEQTEEETMAPKEVEVISLEEVDGAFTTEELRLTEGEYIFEVSNNGIDHEVAFVLAPAKEDLQQEDWIADAMLEKAIADGETSKSKKAVTLTKGEYVYFCPMNPTPQYKLIVE